MACRPNWPVSFRRRTPFELLINTSEPVRTTAPRLLAGAVVCDRRSGDGIGEEADDLGGLRAEGRVRRVGGDHVRGGVVGGERFG